MKKMKSSAEMSLTRKIIFAMRDSSRLLSGWPMEENYKHRKITKMLIALAVGALSLGSYKADAQEKFFRAVGTPHNPKVDIAFNRYYTYEGLVDNMKKIAAAHPDIAKLESIGKSYEGRDMWTLTITDFSTGKDTDKPGMWIDGNIHSNEIQGGEFSLYGAWYLTEMFADNEFVQQLLKDKVFYITPTINPDARNNFFLEPNTANSPRSGMMIRKSPTGRYIKDPQDPRKLIMVGGDKMGEYEMLGQEGTDGDGDGRVNDDGVGYYDPNRDWGWNWQPDYIQRGALKYPFTLPENRSIMEFVKKHPNIAGAQSFHNSGGMILRGPGAEEDVSTYNRSDIRIYDALGQKGQEMIPGYRYLTVYKDLYSVFGGELDWFYGVRGIFTFSNELMVPYLYFHKESGGQSEMFEVDELLTMGDAFVNWHEFEHPQFGTVEIGGFKKNFGRAHPGFLLEQDAHRNIAFTIYHAYHTPKLSVMDVKEEDLGGGLKAITATIFNERLMPTHASQDLKYKIERPDYVTLSGAKVVAGFVVEDEDFNKLTEQKLTPEKISVANILGMTGVKVKWIVSSGSNYSITVDSAKGGKASWKKEK